MATSTSTTFKVNTVNTSPITGQKPGTSGLRKKVVEFEKPNYLENFVQAIFLALEQKGQLALDGSKPYTLVLGGDGRYYNDKAIQIILKLAAANGVSEVFVGQNGIFSTPAVSTVIRKRKATGGIVLTASHNPGGPENDFGIKYNIENGGPAPEAVTDLIFKFTTTISSYSIADLPDIDITKPGQSFTFQNSSSSKSFTVHIIDSVSDYLELMQTIFDFGKLKKLLSRSDFKIQLDSLSGVTGTYSQEIFHKILGVPLSSLLHYTPLPDFGGHHPDPNLTYAHDLVTIMSSSAFELGAAFDGDGDRNMILGRNFFLNPSDSLAIIVANADSIPYFKSRGISAVSRSMPTSMALDQVAKDKKLSFYEVPTGWKFFGNIMDNSTGGGVICGEESFGTGSDHIREKDGIWAVLSWMSILAERNQNTEIGKFVGIEQICKEHWKIYGRNYYCRYDYEEVDAKEAMNMIERIKNSVDEFKKEKKVDGMESSDLKLKLVDDFEYRDQFDGSVSKGQGLRFLYEDGSRIVWRLSGTGSVGATVRLYIEKYENPDSGRLNLETKDVVKPLIDLALSSSKLQQSLKRDAPTVIT